MLNKNQNYKVQKSLGKTIRMFPVKNTKEELAKVGDYCLEKVPS